MDLRAGGVVILEEASRTRHRKGLFSLGTWTVRGLNIAVSPATESIEILRYTLDLVGVQEVKWVEVGPVPAWDYNFFYGKEMKIFRWEEEFLYTKGYHRRL
jgi:hypothetical protein